MTTKLGYSLNSISRLPDEDHVRFCLDNRGQTLAKDRMIFDTQDADLFGVRHNGPPSWRSVTQICSVSQKKRASSEANSANKPERPASQVQADQASKSSLSPDTAMLAFIEDLFAGNSIDEAEGWYILFNQYPDLIVKANRIVRRVARENTL